MSGIDYDHSRNRHSLLGAQTALSVCMAGRQVLSLLDVGCGTGTWLRAALDCGVCDVLGLDGIEVPTERLLVPRGNVQLQNLLEPWDLNRQFDMLLCLEVVEHLEESKCSILLDSITKHSKLIIFSGACPGQQGQHHINCQWPSYWQRLFNERGFVCFDSLRWQVWNDDRIEVWYRQNMFVAQRDPISAGCEPRINSVLHPALFSPGSASSSNFEEALRLIERGCMPCSWYPRAAAMALGCKVHRLFS